MAFQVLEELKLLQFYNSFPSRRIIRIQAGRCGCCRRLAPAGSQLRVSRVHEPLWRLGVICKATARPVRQAAPALPAKVPVPKAAGPGSKASGGFRRQLSWNSRTVWVLGLLKPHKVEDVQGRPCSGGSSCATRRAARLDFMPSCLKCQACERTGPCEIWAVHTPACFMQHGTCKAQLLGLHLTKQARVWDHFTDKLYQPLCPNAQRKGKHDASHGQHS